MKKETGLQKFYRTLVPKITSVGAAAVVVGAMFKIQHWPGASIMLIAGLSTEAALFLLGVMAPSPPPEAHYHWEKVYPELDDSGGTSPVTHSKKLKPMDNQKAVLGALSMIDKALAEGKLDANSFSSFSQGMKKMNQSVSQIKNITEVSAASNEFKTNLLNSSKAIEGLNKNFEGANKAMTSLNTSLDSSKEYHGQLQKITKNLGAMNAIYEMELKDADTHLKAMNRFYGNLNNALENMNQASQESRVFKNQISTLSGNLASLNKVYGNMLNAMKI